MMFCADTALIIKDVHAIVRDDRDEMCILWWGVVVKRVVLGGSTVKVSTLR